MIFEVFEKVLAELESSGNDVFGENWHDEIQSSLIALSSYYGNQNLRDPNRDLIEYGGLPTQAAYIFMYAIGRAEFTYQLLCRFRKHLGVPLFEGTSLNITSVGGGPASEIVGLVRYLSDQEHGEEITEILYDVIDKEGDWDDVVSLVINALQSDIEITPRFYQADLAVSDGAKDISLEFDDLVIMSFFVSEICELPNPKVVKENIEQILGTMSGGSKLFYNDSDAYSFYMYMNNRAKSIKGMMEVCEVQDTIVLDYNDPGATFQAYAEAFDKTPHLSSKAVSKFYERKVS
jgi:Putative SAM-dependent methyltransferase